MKKSLFAFSFIIVVCFCHAQTTITIQTDKKGAKISPTMWGLFFEDINFAADGGVYAEMIKNRSFEFNTPFMGWRRLLGRNPQGRIDVFNSGNSNNPRYIQIINNSPDSLIGLQNDGFRGIGIKEGATYKFSILAKKTGEGNPSLELQLINSKGEIIGRSSIGNFGTEWKKYTTSFTSSVTEVKAAL